MTGMKHWTGITSKMETSMKDLRLETYVLGCILAVKLTMDVGCDMWNGF